VTHWPVRVRCMLGASPCRSWVTCAAFRPPFDTEFGALDLPGGGDKSLPRCLTFAVY